jgi:hypothetical protein
MVAATTICCYAVTLAVGGVATAARVGGKPVAIEPSGSSG